MEAEQLPEGPPVPPSTGDAYVDLIRSLFLVTPEVSFTYRRCTDPDGRYYYHNIKTGATQWNKPSGYVDERQLAAYLQRYFTASRRGEPLSETLDGVPYIVPPAPNTTPPREVLLWNIDAPQGYTSSDNISFQEKLNTYSAPTLKRSASQYTTNALKAIESHDNSLNRSPGHERKSSSSKLKTKERGRTGSVLGGAVKQAKALGVTKVRQRFHSVSRSKEPSSPSSSGSLTSPLSNSSPNLHSTSTTLEVAANDDEDTSHDLSDSFKSDSFKSTEPPSTPTGSSLSTSESSVLDTSTVAPGQLTKILCIGVGKVGRTTLMHRLKGLMDADGVVPSPNPSGKFEEISDVITFQSHQIMVISPALPIMNAQVVSKVLNRNPADCCIVMFNIAQADSFSSIVDLWPFDKMPTILVGNASDLSAKREVPELQVVNWKRSRGIPYYAISAKTGHGFNAMMNGLLNLVTKSSSAAPSPSVSSPSSPALSPSPSMDNIPAVPSGDLPSEVSLPSLPQLPPGAADPTGVRFSEQFPSIKEPVIKEYSCSIRVKSGQDQPGTMFLTKRYICFATAQNKVAISFSSVVRFSVNEDSLIIARHIPNHNTPAAMIFGSFDVAINDVHQQMIETRDALATVSPSTPVKQSSVSTSSVPSSPSITLSSPDIDTPTIPAVEISGSSATAAEPTTTGAEEDSSPATEEEAPSST